MLDKITPESVEDSLDLLYRSGRKNLLINGGFDVAQRATSVTGQTSDAYVLDRWTIGVSGGSTFGVDQQAFDFTTGVTNVSSEYQMMVSSESATGIVQPQQRVENVHSIPKTGTMTLSFLVKSNVPMEVTPSIVYEYDGSTADIITGAPISVTSTEQKVTYTFDLLDYTGATIGSDSYLGVRLTGQENLAYQLTIGQCQLEEGSVATEFERRMPGEEVSLCQRYYQTSYQDDPVGTPGASGYIRDTENTNGDLYLTTELKVLMRAAPSVIPYNNGTGVGGNVNNGGTNRSATANGTSKGRFTVLMLDSNQSLRIIQYHFTADAEL